MGIPTTKQVDSTFHDSTNLTINNQTETSDEITKRLISETDRASLLLHIGKPPFFLFTHISALTAGAGAFAVTVGRFPQLGRAQSHTMRVSSRRIVSQQAQSKQAVHEFRRLKYNLPERTAPHRWWWVRPKGRVGLTGASG